MAFKKLLVPLSGDGNDDVVLETSIAAARRFGAHVEALFVRPDPRETLPFLISAIPANVKEMVVDAADKSSHERADIAHRTFEQWCKNHDIPLVDAPAKMDKPSASWFEDKGSISDAIVRRGRVSDMVVLPRPQQPSPAPEPLEAALLKTGRPVLVVPPTAQSCIASHVVIGWNGSDEAARAVGAAISCLRAAEAVTVVTGRKSAEQKRPNAQDLVDYLAWHGVQAAAKVFDSHAKSAGEGLLNAARELKCDLIVLGGYSHSRAREVMVGGVTRYMLAEADLPIFMAH
jgi:nucleotide-binding universal stress UspA family protein